MPIQIDFEKLKYKTAYGLVIPNNNDPHLKSVTQKSESPEIHGDKIWSSSYLIMDYFRHNRPPKKASILEAGCGWGLLSIYCAKILDAKVTGVDADKHVFPFLKLHAKLNGVKVDTVQSKYEKLSPKFLSNFHTIVGSDICFWDELTPALMKMIKRGLNNGVEKIIIADPGRSPFHKLAKQCKKSFDTELTDWIVDDPKHHCGEILVIKN